jgi:hypothetical protein
LKPAFGCVSDLGTSSCRSAIKRDHQATEAATSPGAQSPPIKFDAFFSGTISDCRVSMFQRWMLSAIGDRCPMANFVDRTSTVAEPQLIACPKCGAALTFRRSRVPFIDSCGFESYRLECQECAVALAGIVDPCDDTLLLSELAAHGR